MHVKHVEEYLTMETCPIHISDVHCYAVIIHNTSRITIFW